MAMVATKRNRPSEYNDEIIKFEFDVSILNILIKYSLNLQTTQSELYNLQKLLSVSPSRLYEGNYNVYSRIETLRLILNLMVEKSISNIDIIKNELSGTYEEGIEILEDISKIPELKSSECEYVKEFVLDKLKRISIHKNKDKIIKLLREIGDSSTKLNVSLYETYKELESLMGETLISLSETTASIGLLKEFSFSGKDAKQVLMQIARKAQQPSAIVQSGIRQLNAILNGGFNSGRLYTIIGGTGKFKSGTLLNITDQLSRFNPQIPQIIDGKRSCILFFTFENSIEETIERLYDMYSDIDADIRSISPEDFYNTLSSVAGYQFGREENGIHDIVFRYAGNLEMNTADVYTTVNNLHNQGMRPIAIVIDYIKRIDSARPHHGDERIRLSNVSKELKNIAQFYQIPVITAMQFNREGNSIIDSAMRENKQDVAKFVGASSIGNAWDIMEDSDWACIINLECQLSTKKLFLTFKRVKMRGKTPPGVVDYFNHPFTNIKNIRLEPDVNKPEPISVISLANDLESIQEDDDKNPSKAFSEKIKERRKASNVIEGLSGKINLPMTS